MKYTLWVPMDVDVANVHVHVHSTVSQFKKFIRIFKSIDARNEYQQTGISNSNLFTPILGIGDTSIDSLYDLHKEHLGPRIDESMPNSGVFYIYVHDGLTESDFMLVNREI